MKLEITNTEELFQKVADKIISTGTKALKNNGRFTVVLSGGSTPEGLYKCLTSEEYRDKLDWNNVFFFFGDERDVSPMSDLSNYHSALSALLKPLGVPNSNIYHWRTEIINPIDVARTYDRTITSFFELSTGEFPVFDLILLGMGEDGHTASLFPNTEALNVDDRICTANFVERLDANRLTLTFPTINNASNIFVMVTGESKNEALKEVLEGEENITKFPAQGIIRDRSIWFVDDAAAGYLTAKSSK